MSSAFLPELGRTGSGSYSPQNGAVPDHLPPVPKSPSLTASTILPDTTQQDAGRDDTFFMRVVDRLEDRESHSKPSTPLAVQSLSNSLHPTNPGTPTDSGPRGHSKQPIQPSDPKLHNGSGTGRRPTPPGLGSSVGSTSMAPQGGLKSEGGKRIRGEIDQLAKELKLLEDLDERERELQRDREKRAMEEKRRREREEEDRRMKEEIEIRKFQEEQKLQRQRREEEAAKKRMKEKREKEEQTQKIMWEYQQNRTRKSPEEEAIAKAEAEENARKEGLRQEKQTVSKSRKTLKTDLRKMYDELDELQDKDYLQKQRMRQTQEALKEAQQDHRVLESTQLEAQFQQMKQREMRQELNGLRDELQKLERQDFLDQQKKRAREEHEKKLKENEAARVIAQREKEKKRAAEREVQQRMREQQLEAQRAAQDAERMALAKEQEEKLGAHRVTVQNVDYRSDYHVWHEHEIRKQKQEAAQILKAEAPMVVAPMVTGTTAPPAPAVAPTGARNRRWLTKEESQRLEQEDIERQRAKQRSDLDALRREHAALVNQDSGGASVHNELNSVLAAEAAEIKSRWNDRNENGRTIRELYPPGSELPNVSLYVPQGFKKKDRPPGPPPGSFSALQEEQARSVRAMEEKYLREKVKAEAAVKKAEEVKEQRRQYWREKELSMQKAAAERERKGLQHASEGLKGELSELHKNLKMLESEDEMMDKKKAEAAAAREREMAEELEKARRLAEAQEELHQDVQRRQQDEIAALQAQLRNQRVEEILAQVEGIKSAKGKEAARWNGYDATKWMDAPPQTEEEKTKNSAAQRIQHGWKMHAAREEMHKRRERKRQRIMQEDQIDSVLRIQCAFRKMSGKGKAANRKKGASHMPAMSPEEKAWLQKEVQEAEASPIPPPTLTPTPPYPYTDSNKDDASPPNRDAASSSNEVVDWVQVSDAQQTLSAAAPETYMRSEPSHSYSPANLMGPAAHQPVSAANMGTMDLETQLRIRQLEDQIASLQGTLSEEREQAAELEVKELELQHLRHEKDHQQKQIDTLNELLLSHANIIKELQNQVVTLSPKQEDIRERTQRMRSENESRESAAKSIQGGWKKHSGRKQLEERRDADRQRATDVTRNEAAEIIQAFFRIVVAKRETARRRKQRDQAKAAKAANEERREDAYEDNEPTPYQGMSGGEERREDGEDIYGASSSSNQQTEEQKRAEAATKIQHFSRQHVNSREESRESTSSERKRTMREKYSHVIQEEAALVIQTNWRGHRATGVVGAKRKKREHALTAAKTEEAAVRIQCAWRKQTAAKKVKKLKAEKWK